MHFHRFGGIDVYTPHEPARLIGPDGNGGQVKGPQPPADFLEILGIARVPRKVEAKELAAAGIPFDKLRTGGTRASPFDRLRTGPLLSNAESLSVGYIKKLPP